MKNVTTDIPGAKLTTFISTVTETYAGILFAQAKK